MNIPIDETQLEEMAGKDYLFFPDADPAKKERDDHGNFKYADRSIDEQLLSLAVGDVGIEKLFLMKEDLELGDLGVLAVCFDVKKHERVRPSRALWTVAVIQTLCWKYPTRKATILRYAAGTLDSVDLDQLAEAGSREYIEELVERVDRPLSQLIAMMPKVVEHADHDKETVVQRLQGVANEFNQISTQYEEALARDHGVVLKGVTFISDNEGEVTGYMEDDLSLELVDIGAGGDDKAFVDLKDENGEERPLAELVCDECDMNVVVVDKHEAYCPSCQRVFLSKRSVSELTCEDCGETLMYIGTNESYCAKCDKIFSKMTSISGIQDAVKVIEKKE